MIHEDIENEAKAVAALCTSGLSKYVVEVHRHGWLQDSFLYFIDMECCDRSLEDYIRSEMGRELAHDEHSVVRLSTDLGDRKGYDEKPDLGKVSLDPAK